LWFLKGHGYVLTPGRYVGAEDIEDDDVPFTERFAALQTTLDNHFLETEELTLKIRTNLAKVVSNG
jgi:type I restriction enzyme M protein